MMDVLGVPPLLGRTFAPGEDEAGRARVVLLGYGLWQRRFGANPAIVGSDILLDGQPYTVVGVMPPSFRFAPFWQTRAELWAPLALTARRDDRDGRSLRVFGRLRAGVSLAQAQQEMTAIASRLEREHPSTNTGIAITIRPLLDKVVAGVRGDAARLDGDGHLRAADRLRERRELDAGTGVRAGSRKLRSGWRWARARGAWCGNC